MRRLALVALAASFMLIVVGCGSGSVSAEDVKPYQEAGLKPGEKVQTATPLPGDAKGSAGQTGGSDR